MSVTDVKVSLRKRGTTDFATDGFRLLPVTKPQYILGLLGPDGKLADQYAPATTLEGSNYLGIADLDEQGTISIGNLYASEFGSTVDPTAAGSYLKVTSPGILSNTVNPTKHTIFGPGDEGVDAFPMHLEVGDYIILKSVDASGNCKWSIRNNSYEIATVDKYGITKLYNGVNSALTTLAATAGAVKTAYDLAASKETAFTKNSAFNKNFGTVAGTVVQGNDSRMTDSRPASDVYAWAKAATKPSYTYSEVGAAAASHNHGTFDRAAAAVGGNVIADITINKGIVTALTWQSLASIAGAAGLAVVTDLDYYQRIDDASAFQTYIEGQTNTAKANALIADKRGLMYYTSVASADAGAHNAGDIVAVLEA